MKLKPTKYTNVDLSVIGISIEITKILRRTKTEKYDALLLKVEGKRGSAARENYRAALLFLYSLGRIEYYPEDDVVAMEA